MLPSAKSKAEGDLQDLLGELTFTSSASTSIRQGAGPGRDIDPVEGTFMVPTTSKVGVIRTSVVVALLDSS